MEIVSAEGQVVVEERYRIKATPKSNQYMDCFKKYLAGSGFTTAVVRGRFMVYRDGQPNISIQIAATHQDLLRAYFALRISCEGDIERFVKLDFPLLEVDYPILPLSPLDSDARYPLDSDARSPPDSDARF